MTPQTAQVRSLRKTKRLQQFARAGMALDMP